MELLLFIFKVLYAYCTDFVINLANISGTSYYEVNFVIFIIIYPLFLILAPTIFIIQKLRLSKLKEKHKTTIKINKQKRKKTRAFVIKFIFFVVFDFFHQIYKSYVKNNVSAFFTKPKRVCSDLIAQNDWILTKIVS